MRLAPERGVWRSARKDIAGCGPTCLVLPHAGGGPFAAMSLAQDCPQYRVHVADYPWRTATLRDADDFERFIAVAVREAPLNGVPVVLYGHSMGAIAAFRIALGLQQERGTTPAVVVLSGSGPEPAARHVPFAQWTDAELRSHLASLDPLVGDRAGDLCLDDSVLSMVRSDYAAYAGASNEGRVLAGSRVLVVGGDDDPLVGVDDLLAWSAHVPAGQLSVRVASGGHFAVRDHMGKVAAALASGFEKERDSHETRL